MRWKRLVLPSTPTLTFVGSTLLTRYGLTYTSFSVSRLWVKTLRSGVDSSLPSQTPPSLTDSCHGQNRLSAPSHNASCPRLIWEVKRWRRILPITWRFVRCVWRRPVRSTLHRKSDMPTPHPSHSCSWLPFTNSYWRKSESRTAIKQNGCWVVLIRLKRLVCRCRPCKRCSSVRVSR